MKRRAIRLQATLTAASIAFFLAMPASTVAQTSRARSGSLMASPHEADVVERDADEPSSDSVQYDDDPPPRREAYQPSQSKQRPRSQPTKSRGASNIGVRRAASSNRAYDSRYFDPHGGRRRTAPRGRASRAAYEELPAPEASVMESSPGMPPGVRSLPQGPSAMPPIMSEEVLPPGDVGPMPAGQMLPSGPLRYRRGGMPYGGPMPEGDCGCNEPACGGCGDYGCVDCDTCDDWYPGKDLTLFAGVHGFKGPVDNGRNGDFGFHEGVNWSTPFWNAAGIGFQLGVQAAQSNFHESAFFSDDRSQFFVTTGIFRRQMCERGWQWGIVYDHVFDEFNENFDVSQIRGELSYLFRGHELGFLFASGSADDQPGADSNSEVLSYEALDMYAAFYRRRLMFGGEGRLWGGVTGRSDAVFGGDVRVPLACDWDLTAAFNFVSPQDNSAADGQFDEAWNIGINLVWYVCPEGATRASHSRYRPLFNVADNGSLIVDTLR